MNWSLGPEKPLEQHLQAAVDWLLRAQTATPDDGVAHSYDLRRGLWHASYPETTGYVIPTLLDYASLFKQPRFAEAALRMADWEIAMQMPMRCAAQPTGWSKPRTPMAPGDAFLHPSHPAVKSRPTTPEPHLVWSKPGRPWVFRAGWRPPTPTPTGR